MDSSSRRRSRPEPRARVPRGAERGSRCPWAGARPPMTRKLVIGLVAAGLFLTGFGGAVLPASVDPHHFLLKLANGTSVPWTGEPGSAPSTITVAGISIPVVSVQDLGAVVQQGTPTVATPPPPPTPTTPATPVTPKPKPTTTTTQKSTTPQKQSAQPSQSPSKSSQPTVSAKPKKKASASQEPTGGTQTKQQTTGKKSTKKKSQASDEASKKAKKS